METEEDLLPCVRIKIYHPQQGSRAPYRGLPLGTRRRHPADEPLRMGRDERACALTLADPRVSRKQLSVQAYRDPGARDLLFSVQNLSRRVRLHVNSSDLDYLERTQLPEEALVRFGEYQMLVVREAGEAEGSFEVEVEALPESPAGWRGACVCAGAPVAETGTSWDPEGPSGGPGPLETDETLMWRD